MKEVLTVGVFDMLHIGHMLLFKHIKEMFGPDSRLIVAVQEDASISKYKSGGGVYSTEERCFMVSSIRWVDEVVVYSDVDKDIRNIGFDVFVKGPDQMHVGFQNAVAWCASHGKEVVVIPRTEGVSSSLLRMYYKSVL